MIRLNITGLNHNSASVEVREKLSLSGESYESFLNQLKAEANIDELVILSTCNRTEFIYHSEHEGSPELLSKFITDHAEISEEEFKAHFYNLEDIDALHHVFSVASGLNSLVIGETQILGQLKEAFDHSVEVGYTTSNFNNIYQKVLQCAKRVQRETEISKGSMSVSYIAVQLAINIYDSLTSKNVLLIGAGEMCELAGVHFQEAGVRSINVVNRSIDKAKNLAGKFNGQSYSLDQLEEAATKADIILSSTASKDYIITKDLVQKILKKRKGAPLFLIDIAVPRDIDPAVNDFYDVYIYNIDDLEKIVKENRNSRNMHIKKAERIVSEEINSFKNDMYTAGLGPVIVSLKERVNETKLEELKKLYNKNPDMPEDLKKQIERSMDLLINKVLHDPIISLREGVQKDEDNKLIKIFKDFFNL